MRYIERDGSLAPKYLTSPETMAAVAEFGEFVEGGGVSSKQAYADADAGEILRRGGDELVQACFAQFSQKCAFTEMQMLQLESPTGLHLLRPGQGARGERGEAGSERHYWWLINDWANLYLADPAVDSLKGEIYPVVGDRMEGPDSALDQGMVLDPCCDRPEWYVRFDGNGEVTTASLLSFGASTGFSPPTEYVDLESLNVRRSELSIRLYGLDRTALTESRRAAITDVIAERDSSEREILEALDRLDQTTPYLGAIRQVLAQKVIELEAPPLPRIMEELRPELGALAWTQPGAADKLVSLLDQAAADVLEVGGEVFPELVGLAGPVGEASYNTLRPVGAAFEETAGLPPINLVPAIKRIVIKDFKAIEDIEITIGNEPRVLSEPNRFQRLYEDLSARAATPTKADGSQVQIRDDAKTVTETRVFIGENGSGKSSVLQAIALALASAQERAALEVDLQDFIRWDITDQGPRPNPTREAVVTVELLSGTFTLTIKPDGQVIHTAVDPSMNPIDTSGESPWFLMRAYSATRTLKGDHASNKALSIRNLFDPRVPLVKPEDWLLTLDDQQFGTVAATLHQLFNESNADNSSPVANLKMDRLPVDEPTKIVVGNVELRHLSDGYRAVITLFCDIMAAAQSLNPTNMRAAEGIVLIDEIGAHLHPRWRTRISSLIRREFARMQIIVSTHEPLCMRGFLGGEVMLVERDDDVGVRLTSIERDPSGLRVDQLLTSEFFGLYTTLDPEENDRLNLYYQLRAKKAERGELLDWEQDLLERVKPEETQQVFGFSYREQLTYEAIDAYLTDRRRRITPEQERQRRDTAFKEVAEIWRAFERTRAPGDPT